MLVRAPTLLFPDLYLLPLGRTCRYIFFNNGQLTLFDVGCSSHIAFLIERISSFGFSPANIKKVLITHVDADRIGGIPLLRKVAPQLKLFTTKRVANALREKSILEKLWQQDQELSAYYGLTNNFSISAEDFWAGLSVDFTIEDSEPFELNNTENIRALTVATPGHTEESIAYIISPYGFLICDQTFGYFNGRKLASPGGDHNLRAAVHSINKFTNTEISGLGLPYIGALTGDLVRKHLNAVIQNTDDLFSEVDKARIQGISTPDIIASIKDSFYLGERDDFSLTSAMEQTLKSVCHQLSLT